MNSINLFQAGYCTAAAFCIELLLVLNNGRSTIFTSERDTDVDDGYGYKNDSWFA